MYNAVLDFFPKHYTKLREITTGTGQGYVFILSVIAEPVPVALLVSVPRYTLPDRVAVRPQSLV